MSLRTLRHALWTLLTGLKMYLVDFIMPSRGKRVMLIASVHQQLVREGVFKEETLEKLNSHLSLVKDDRILPWLTATGYRAWDHTLLHKTIEQYVRGKIGNACLTYSDARRISEALVEASPHCLRYANKEEMIAALVELFYYQTSSKDGVATAH